MATQTISFSTPRSRVGGEIVPEGSDIPKMRPRTKATDAELAALLSETLEDLADCPCCFWACDGPRKPKYMVTCRKCWAMRQVATVLESLKSRTANRQQVKGDRG